jgi:hypothetical protein
MLIIGDLGCLGTDFIVPTGARDPWHTFLRRAPDRAHPARTAFTIEPREQDERRVS